jgi:hypothetical protein
VKVSTENSYMLKILRGEHLPRALNGRYLKKYYPSVWQDASVVKDDVLTSPIETLAILVHKCFLVCKLY